MELSKDLVANFLDMHREILEQYYKPYFKIIVVQRSIFDKRSLFCDMDGNEVESTVLQLQERKMLDFIIKRAGGGDSNSANLLPEFIRDELGGGEIYYNVFTLYCSHECSGIKKLIVDDFFHKRLVELTKIKFSFFEYDTEQFTKVNNLANIGNPIEFSEATLEFDSNVLLYREKYGLNQKPTYTDKLSHVFTVFDTTGKNRAEMSIVKSGDQLTNINSHNALALDDSFLILTGKGAIKSLLLNDEERTSFTVHDVANLSISACRKVLYNTPEFYVLDNQLRLKEIASIVFRDLKALNLKMIASVGAASSPLNFFMTNLYPVVCAPPKSFDNISIRDFFQLFHICDVAKGNFKLLSNFFNPF